MNIIANNTLTNKQAANYTTIYNAMWKIASKTIPTNKKQRSAAFALAREESMKIALNNNAKNYTKVYDAMWRMIDKTVRWNKSQRSMGFALSRIEAAKIAL